MRGDHREKLGKQPLAASKRQVREFQLDRNRIVFETRLD
jgi:hypothetical protein